MDWHPTLCSVELLVLVLFHALSGGQMVEFVCIQELQIFCFCVFAAAAATAAAAAAAAAAVVSSLCP